MASKRVLTADIFSYVISFLPSLSAPSPMPQRVRKRKARDFDDQAGSEDGDDDEEEEEEEDMEEEVEEERHRGEGRENEGDKRENWSKYLLSLSLVCRHWRTMMASEEVWIELCRRDWQLEDRVSPLFSLSRSVQMEEAPSYREAWKRMYLYNRRVSSPGGQLVDAGVLRRAAEVWQTIETWLAANLPHALDTLNIGIDREDVFETIGKELRTPIAPSVKAIFSFHDGQVLLPPLTSGARYGYFSSNVKKICSGILGGYSCYDKLICTRLFPVVYAMRLTEKLRPHQSFLKNDRTKIAIACSWDLQKAFFLDISTGNLFILAGQDLIPCCGGLTGAVEEFQSDSFLSWLEEYAKRLKEGVYRKSEILPGFKDSEGIQILPASGPSVSRAITRGVEVKASALFTLFRDRYTYRIMIRIVPEGEYGHLSEEERGFETCQLESRHWKIVDGRGRERHVSGEGVVGRMPILAENGFIEEGKFTSGWFEYQSNSGRLAEDEGTFGGHINFYPGTIAQPTGRPFPVTVADFPLKIPEFIF